MADFDSAARLQALLAIANQLKLKVTYIHEDVVFVEHNNFLFQLDPADDLAAAVRFNRECKPAEIAAHTDAIMAASGVAPDVRLRFGGSYSLAQGDDGQLKLEFFPMKT